jgi:hypothetical protein
MNSSFSVYNKRKNVGS